jgi:CRISPR/Cas system-associated exonuclease Cas4 (RecB family)
MKTLLLSPAEDLIEEVIRHLEGTGRDYSAEMVVFPGKRPSHFLRKSLAGKIGDSFIPPAVFSMDEFIDHLSEELIGGRRIETIDAVSILYDIHRRVKDPLGGSGFMTPDSFFPLGLKIYRDIEELHIEGVSVRSVEEVRHYSDEAIPEQSVKRLQSLAFFYEEFYRHAEGEGFSTRSLRYRRVAERIEGLTPASVRRMIFAGFHALTGAEKILFTKLGASGNTTFLFQDGPGMVEIIGQLGMEAERSEQGPSRPEISFYGSPDTHGQVYALGRIFDAEAEGAVVRDERTAVVLPSSETLFPVLRQGLPFLKEAEYNISMGYPLRRTPVFGFLNSLMELVNSMDGDRVYIPSYLRFILHPYTKNIYYRGNAELTRIMFHALEDELTGNRTKTFMALSEIEGDEKILRSMVERMPDGEKVTVSALRKHLRAIHRNTIENFLSFENLRDFAVRCTELLIYIYNNSTARLHPLFHPFAESFIKSLDVISRSLMKEMAFSERASYFSFFGKYIATCHTPFDGTPVKGLQVLGFLETRNIKFDRVFLLDANEETLPDTRKEDSLLPFKARRILGLPTYVERDRLAAYYFETLTRGAKEVHLFFVENDKKERSRFVEKLLWEMQKRDRTTETRKYVRTVQYRVRLKNGEPAGIGKTDEMAEYLRHFTYSPTALDTYLSCPLQFYYRYVLRIDKKEGISGEIERVDIGKFVHGAISAYFSARKGLPLKVEDLSVEEMESLVDRLFALEYGDDLSGAVYLLKMQVRRHLRDLLIGYYLPLAREGTLVIVESEKKISGMLDGFMLKGRVDSVEKRGGRLWIIDYKTGSSLNRLKIDFDRLDPADRGTWGRAIGSLQLPVYLMVYTQMMGNAAKNPGAMFLLLGKSVISRDIELPLFAGSDPGESMKDLEAITVGLLNEIADPLVPFGPAVDSKTSCPGCIFHYICGTQWVSG